MGILLEADVVVEAVEAGVVEEEEEEEEEEADVVVEVVRTVTGLQEAEVGALQAEEEVAVPHPLPPTILIMKVR
jgi:hypothetical protein